MADFLKPPIAPGTTVMQFNKSNPWNCCHLSYYASVHDPQRKALALEARQPLGRLVSAQEVAAAIAYLASPLAGSTTGTVLGVDGGMYGLRLPR